nr:hypothetical protein [Streptomyces lydicus]
MLLLAGGLAAVPVAYDEAFRATAHESHHEIRAQAERKAPPPSPDGRWRPGDGPGRAARESGCDRTGEVRA